MKKIAIGTSDFKTLIDENYYYVDKSLFIKEIIEDGARVILIPRPRRFGKTLNMSLLRYFYEQAKDGEDSRHLFKGLKIDQYGEIMSRQGKYPVIYLTFKDEKYSTWADCKRSIELLMSNLYSLHKYILDGDKLNEYQKSSFINILSEKADMVELSKSLSQLCYYLYEYHKTKVVILIDEYDVPIQSGYLNHYYDSIIEFMRNFLSGALKDNTNLEKAVLTGILRVSKESIFSGLNNLEVSTILKNTYDDSFGFIEFEVEQLLKDHGLESQINEVRNWYNGYSIGKQIIYNPWSILSYVKNHEEGFKPYWINTSSNDLVIRLLTKGGEVVKQELESLMKGEEIVKVINEDIVMHEIDKGTENVWSFLLFSGYLKIVKKEVKHGKTYCNLQIPNLEVLYLYQEIIMSWFKESINNDRFTLMLGSLIRGDLETFEDILSEFVMESVSYFDTEKSNESFYHAFVLGMLIGLGDDYQVESNRESGYGRYDVMVIPKDKRKLGIVMEFKKVNQKKNEDLEIAVEAALKQIQDKNYKQELINRSIDSILEIGIAFQGKELLVRKK